MTEAINETESAESAARRYAVELHRLETGLRDRGIRPPSGTPVDSWAVDLALSTIDRFMSDDPHHVIDLRADGWTIKHPLSCRPHLFDCLVNQAALNDLIDPPAQLGRFECDTDDSGLLVIDYSARRTG